MNQTIPRRDLNPWFLARMSLEQPCESTRHPWGQGLYRLNKNKEYVSLLCTSDIEDAMHRLELAEARDDKEES
jgi:hypothetical protein